VTLERLNSLLNRLSSYPPLEVAIELLLIGLVVYTVFRFVRGTRAAGALKGLFLVLVFATVVARVIGAGESFQRVAFLYDRFLAIVAVGLLVIFQPELRRGLIRLGEATFWRQSTSAINQTVEALVEACAYFSKSRFGAIIVVQREVALRGLVEGGTPINAELSSRLLQTIFFPGTALHDLAVIVKGNTVVAAGVQLPLADPADMPDPRLGSRHRAAVGLTKEGDALVVVVSEETGEIRISERGQLFGPFTQDQLRHELLHRLRLEQDRDSGGPGPELVDGDVFEGERVEGPKLVGGSEHQSRAKEPAA
jgi:diadenylate cyclase